MQSTKRSITFSSVVCPALPHFSSLSHKLHDCRETVFEYKICVLIFSTILSETFLILRRIQRDTIINVSRSSYKVAVILVRLKQTLECLNRFLKNIKISNFMKILSVGAELFIWMDRRTDRHDEANSSFRNFADSPTYCYMSLWGFPYRLK